MIAFGHLLCQTLGMLVLFLQFNTRKFSRYNEASTKAQGILPSKFN